MSAERKKLLWQVISWAVIGLLGFGAKFGYEKLYLNDIVLKEKAGQYAYDYCDTMDAVPANVVTPEMPMLYIDYNVLKLFPSPYNSYELRGYIGNAAGIVIANSQTNSHGKDIWGPTQYAKDYDDRTKTKFKGNGFHIPQHLETGDYTYVIEMVFHTEFGDMSCTKVIPFMIMK